MSTERINDNQVIGFKIQNRTARNDDSIISSASGSPQVISSSFSNEVTLNGIKYNVEKQFPRSGEAEVFLVSKDGHYSVFKYYYSQYKPKDQILTKLKGLQHTDIICLLDYGYYENRFFEISEYAQGGTLQDIMPVTSVQKIKEIVGETIEALNYCHTNGIIHRDIKPENIFYRTSDKKDVAIGDFGIASNVKEGEEHILTSFARTSVYAAPELFTHIQGRTIIEKSVDYYALGMTLLHLWFGRNPFEDIDEYGIMRLKSEGRVQFPENIDGSVEKLIKGLLTVIPQDRWGYDEVKRWMNGEDVKVHYQTIRFEYKPYSFGLIEGQQIVVNSPKELVFYLEKYPEKGEGHLYRNSIARWVEPVDQGLFNDLMDIVEKDYPRDKAAGLAKALYILNTEKPFKGFNNITLRTQEEMALHFEQNFGHYKKVLSNPHEIFYVFLEARNLKDKANEYRSYFKQHNADLALNALILDLQGGDKLMIDNYTIYQPTELLRVNQGTKNKIIQQLSDTDSKLSLWISRFQNLQNSINTWRIEKKWSEATLRYALLQGFEMNGDTASDISDFKERFSYNLSYFFGDQDASTNREKADYWLVKYQNTFLAQVVIDVIKAKKNTDEYFISMLKYVVEKNNTSPYELIEELLYQIKKQTSSNYQLFGQVVEIFRQNIETCWTKEHQSRSARHTDSLIGYLVFVEKNSNSYPELFTQLSYALNTKISEYIHLDIGSLKNNENRLHSYRQELQQIVNRLKNINSGLPYIRHYEQELILIDHRKQSVTHQILAEKNDKITLLNKEYDDILEQKKINTKKDYEVGITSEQFQGKIAIVTAIVLSLFFLVVLITDFSRVSIWESLFSVVLYVFALALFSGIAMLLGSFIYPLVKPIIWLFGRQKAADNIQLTKTDKDAYNKSLAEINRFFSEKESFEYHGEIIRVLLLDDTQLEREISAV